MVRRAFQYLARIAAVMHDRSSAPTEEAAAAVPSKDARLDLTPQLRFKIGGVVLGRVARFVGVVHDVAPLRLGRRTHAFLTSVIH